MLSSTLAERTSVNIIPRHANITHCGTASLLNLNPAVEGLHTVPLLAFGTCVRADDASGFHGKSFSIDKVDLNGRSFSRCNDGEAEGEAQVLSEGGKTDLKEYNRWVVCKAKDGEGRGYAFPTIGEGVAAKRETGWMVGIVCVFWMVVMGSL
ncbi:hypothetical protein DM02DRAFT_632429 [Periconia macrospinosa]|uniref:Uncharacterized protein n=1 Tax=Periconia macrospinosa TaxID=97972 RepID=A0A2V1DCY8_9PLEO|nr:hypothetical protein DM02DRAFT_632429 [Periconia macrospinosa]